VLLTRDSYHFFKLVFWGPHHNCQVSVWLRDKTKLVSFFFKGGKGFWAFLGGPYIFFKARVKTQAPPFFSALWGDLLLGRFFGFPNKWEQIRFSPTPILPFQVLKFPGEPHIRIFFRAFWKSQPHYLVLSFRLWLPLVPGSFTPVSFTLSPLLPGIKASFRSSQVALFF